MFVNLINISVHYLAQHSLRVNRLAIMLAECGGEIVKINNELSENAWASQQLGENGLEIFCTIEEIVLETLEKAMCRVIGKIEKERIIVTEKKFVHRKISINVS